MIDELKKIRLEKLKAIINTGVSAYPGETKRTHTIIEAIKKYPQISSKKQQIVLVGRIKSIRGHGGSTFLDIEDGTGKIQGYFKKDKIGEKQYKFFLENFDIGDFIEIKGILFKTRKQEKTIEVNDFKILTKAILSLPEKWHGLKDIEERFRKRYLDLIFNPEIKKKFEIRSKIVKEIRNFLEKQGFLEVETPILQKIYGGAAARPFKTHLNALDLDLYLRIAPELYLKRLLVGGFEKIYEIGRCFRNEGIDRAHNPEFTILEFYWAYADYKDLIKLTEKMFETILKRIFKKTEIEYQEKKIDFKMPWKKIEYNTLFKKYCEIDLEEIDQPSLIKKAKEFGIKLEQKMNRIEIIDEIFKKKCKENLIQPTFVIHFPIETKPLAKALDKNYKKAANFQLVAGGIELINAYSELNDPIKQRKIFENQEKFFKLGLEEAHRMDEDFLESLEYGMPPAAGFGMGIDRLVALFTDSHGLKDIIFFPFMRSKEN